MGEDKKIPLTENEKAVIGRYLQEIQNMRSLLAIKSQALDDMLGLMIEARGLSTDAYTIDMAKAAIVERMQGEESESRRNKN